MLPAPSFGELQQVLEQKRTPIIFQPIAPPVLAGHELQGISFSCYEIGGDYYDFILRKDGRLVIALGDISGKGIAAVLLMSSLHAAIHAQTGAHDTLAATISAAIITSRIIFNRIALPRSLIPNSSPNRVRYPS